MPEQAKAYKYFAFISYSRKDSKMAAWLYKRLSWFRFPVKLVPADRRPPTPPYLRPIFRDKNDLEVTKEHYWNDIRQRLDESRFLIVLCSPHSAKSEPVNMEVSHFLSTHDGDTSLLAPVIASGSVASTGDDAAFCPALRALGDCITIRNLPTMVPDADTAEQDAWEEGFVALTSYLLQVKRKEIGDHIQRETRRQAKVLRGWLVTVLVLTVCAVVGGIFAVMEKRRGEELLWKASNADCEAARLALDADRWSEGTALLNRALSYRPMNRAAIVASGMNAFGLCAPSWRLRSVSRLEGPVTQVAVSADGTRVAAVSGKRGIRFIDTVSGRETGCSPASEVEVRDMAFSADGRELSVLGWAEEPRVVDEATNELIKQQKLGVRSYYSTVWQDGVEEFEGIWDEAAWLVSVESGAVARHLAINPESEILFLSQQGERVAEASANGTVRVLDMRTGSEVQAVQAKGKIESVTFTPNAMRFWMECEAPAMVDVASGRRLWEHPKEVGSASVYFDALGTRMLRLTYDYPTQQSIREAMDVESGINAGNAITLPRFAEPSHITADGEMVLATYGEMWQRTRWMAVSMVNAEQVSEGSTKSDIRVMQSSPDGQFVALGLQDGHVVLHEARTGRWLAEWSQAGAVTELAFSEDGRFLVSGSVDGTVRVYEPLPSGETLRMDLPWPVNAVAFGGASTVFGAASGGADAKVGGEVRVARVDDGKVTHRVLFEREAHSLAFDLAGTRAVAGSYDDTVRVVELGDGKVSTRKYASSVNDVSMSPDGRLVAAAVGSMFPADFTPEGPPRPVPATGLASVFEVGSEIERGGTPFLGMVGDVRFSPDGQQVVAIGPGAKVRVMDVATGQWRELAELEMAWVWGLAFSPDGKFIGVATGFSNPPASGSAWLFDAMSGRTIRCVGGGSPVSDIAFSADGRTMGYGTDDGFLRTLSVNSERGGIERAMGAPVGSLAYVAGADCWLVSTARDAQWVSAATGKVLGRRKFKNTVSGLSVSGDGRLCGVGCSDASARVFDAGWLKPDTGSSKVWADALQLAAGEQFGEDGLLVPVSAEELVAAQESVRELLAQPPASGVEWWDWLMGEDEKSDWQRHVLTWLAKDPRERTASPWSRRRWHEVVGAWLMQTELSPETMADCLRDGARNAPWHPLAPLSLAREALLGGRQSDANVATSGERYLGRLTLKRLREADEQLYGRTTLAEYAAWSAKIMHEEFHLDLEAREAFAFAFERTPPEKQKELLELQAKLDGK